MSFKFTNDNINNGQKEAIMDLTEIATTLQKEQTIGETIPTISVTAPHGAAIATASNGVTEVHSLKNASVFTQFELSEDEVFIVISFRPSNEGMAFLISNHEQAIISMAKDDKFSAYYIFNRVTGEVRTEWRNMNFDMSAPKIEKRLSVLTQQHHQSFSGKVVYMSTGEYIAPEDKQEDTIYVQFAEGSILTDGDNRMNERASHMLDISEDVKVVNARLMGYFETMWGSKGDYTIGEDDAPCFASGADIIIYSDNINPELGLTEEHAGTILIGVTTPQHQYKPVRSNPQIEAAFGRSLYDIMDDYFNRSVWDVQAARVMGRGVAMAMLGRNVFPSKGFDGEIKGAAEAAEYLTSQVGSTLPSRWLYQFGLGQVKQRFDKSGMKFGDAFRKERIITPHAFSLSIRSEALLEDFGIATPEEFGEESPFFFTAWGVVVHSSIYKDFTDSTGGSDLDDKIAVMMGKASEDITIDMRSAEGVKAVSFESGEYIMLMVRFPMGARLTSGRLGVEYYVGRPCNGDKIFGKQLDKAIRMDGPIRKFAQADFPTHILDVDAPMHIEPKASEKLELAEKAERLLALQGVFGTFSLRVASLIWLSVNYPTQFKKIVAGRSIDVSMEFAIDASTQFFNLNDIELIKESSEVAHEMIIEIVNLIGEVDYMFAHRTQLTSKYSTEQKPHFIPEVDSTVSVVDWNSYMANRKAWKRSLTKVNTFMGRMSAVYSEQFETGNPKSHFSKLNLKSWKVSMEQHEGNFDAVANELGEDENFVSDLLRAQFAGQGTSTLRTNNVSRTIFSTKLAAKTTDILVESNAVSKMMATLTTEVFLPMLGNANFNMDDPFNHELVRTMLGEFNEKPGRIIDFEGSLQLSLILDEYRGLDGFANIEETYSIDECIWDEEEETYAF